MSDPLNRQFSIVYKLAMSIEGCLWSDASTRRNLSSIRHMADRRIGGWDDGGESLCTLSLPPHRSGCLALSW